MMQAGVALQTSYSSMHTYRQIGEYKYRDNEIPGTPTYPRSQEVSGLDMGVQYTMYYGVQDLSIDLYSMVYRYTRNRYPIQHGWYDLCHGEYRSGWLLRVGPPHVHCRYGCGHQVLLLLCYSTHSTTYQYKGVLLVGGVVVQQLRRWCKYIYCIPTDVQSMHTQYVCNTSCDALLYTDVHMLLLCTLALHMYYVECSSTPIQHTTVYNILLYVRVYMSCTQHM